MNDLQSVLSFLQTRRSTPPAALEAPYPSRKEIEAIAAMGMRVPDHKKLEPWRLVVIEGDALRALAALVASEVDQFQADAQKAQKVKTLYENAGLVIALIYAPKPEDSIPQWEQELSVGAVGISLVNAAIAHGYGASWMTGFLPESAPICAHIGLGEGESLRGLIHIGTVKTPPPERPRPKLASKLTFL